MHFTASAMALLAAAGSVAANSITLWTLDDVTRTVYFVPNAGSPPIAPVTVNNKKNTTVDVPHAWQGNYRAFPTGSDEDKIAKESGNPPNGMLAEVTFNNWLGHTSFDVSAIVAPQDHNNIKQMWPVDANGPMSGCPVYPCNNAYWHPEDNLESLDTPSGDLMTTLGEGHTGISFVEHAHAN